MDETCARLASHIDHLAAAKSPQRILIGIAGPPGSGKTTIAAKLVERLQSTNTPTPTSDASHAPRVVALPMDGFHYTRAHLDTFANAAEAHHRRGAPWTFDPAGVVDLVRRLKEASSAEPASARRSIYAPSFDHAVKDPVADDIHIPPSAGIVILEGNYLLLDEEVWREIGPMLDYRVLIRVEREEARRRVAKRHVEAGLAETLAAGEERFDTNDWLNGELILAQVGVCDEVVESKPQ